MKVPFTPTGAQLADALYALGIQFVRGGHWEGGSLHQHPACLIAGLAQSSEARLRMALIPLFLKYTAFAEMVPTIADTLNASPKHTLQCYYTAAVYLQQKYRHQLDHLVGQKAALPDYFSNELGLEDTGDVQENLCLLANCQQVLSGAQINWLGSYDHAVKVWLRGLALQNT